MYFKYDVRKKFDVRGWNKIYPESDNQKKTGIAILISDEVDFKARSIGFNDKR